MSFMDEVNNLILKYNIPQDRNHTDSGSDSDHYTDNLPSDTNSTESENTPDGQNEDDPHSKDGIYLSF